MSKNRKIRVLEVVHGLAPGGIESFILNLYEDIDDENIEISFALATGNYKNFHEDRVIERGGKVYRTTDLYSVKYIFKHFFRLIKLMKREGPFDVVHSHMDFFNGINILAAFIAGVPIRISHSHNTNSANIQNENISYIIKIYRFIMKILINTFSTRRLGCSKDANIYMYGKNQDKCEVIYNGIDLEKFYGINKSDVEVIKTDKNKINFITIGRMCEQKNSLFIVNIIKELINIREDIHLYWIGDGPKKNDIIDLIHEYNLDDNITLLGLRKDIPDILAIMDFMIFPSKWEGLGIVLVEAQASGVPCFISDKIPQEADLGLCTIISLSDNEKVWANKINTYINTSTFNNSLREEDLNRYSIHNVSNIVKQIYMNERVNDNVI